MVAEEDYRLSRNELEKHDVILFVIDDSETFDNRIVTQEILKIIQMNKPLIIVLNNKQIADSDEGDEMRAQQIRKKIFANLQREAENYGIEKIQSKYTFYESMLSQHCEENYKISIYLCKAVVLKTWKLRF